MEVILFDLLKLHGMREEIFSAGGMATLHGKNCCACSCYQVKANRGSTDHHKTKF